MASNPMLQSVLLFQHHQTSTPFMPTPLVVVHASTVVDMAKPKPKEEKETKDDPPFDTEEENDKENGENDKEKEEGDQNG